MSNNFSNHISSDVHKLISRSNSIGVNMDTAMHPGIQVIFYKHKPGAYFWVAIEETCLTSVTSSEVDRALLRRQSENTDRIVIATIEQCKNNYKDYIIRPVIESADEKYHFCLDLIVDRFLLLLNSYSQWLSFTAFLEVDNMYNVNNDGPEKQYPLGYHFLIGDLEDSNYLYHVGHLPSGKGLYVMPDSKILPVFTSAIYADIFAQDLLTNKGIKLEPEFLPCVKCYLSGSYNSINQINITGALLNGQWLLDCYSCATCEDYSGHFYLNDGQNKYALHGCPNQGIKPIWIEQRWANKSSIFKPECGMIPWGKQ